MTRPTRGWLGGALAWLAFPVVPALLERVHYDVVNLSLDGHGGPDPVDWDWFKWVTLLGPLVGFGFLAGATLDLPDDDDDAARGWRSRRAVWVAVGPWAGLLAWGALVLLLMLADAAFPGLTRGPLSARWHGAVGESVRSAVWAAFVAFTVVTLCYAWLWPAAAALRRARRRGRVRGALARGLAVALAFVGSLLGAFWAVVQAWRSYFFDKTVVPVVLAGLALAALGGCTAPVTYGDVRRRELFQALLVSWVLGLALVWRWWSRPRGKP